MKSKGFNNNIFLTALFLFGLLTIITFIAATSADDATSGLFVTRLAKIFLILRFPTHVLFWDFFGYNGSFIFYAGLVINCFFYAFVVERLLSGIQKINTGEAK